MATIPANATSSQIYDLYLQLTEPERTRLLARLASDSDAANEEKFEWFFVRQAFADHLVWGYALLFHGFAFALYSLSLFTVRFDHLTIVRRSGYSHTMLADYHRRLRIPGVGGAAVSTLTS